MVKPVSVGRVLLTALAAVLYMLGWTVAVIVAAIRTAVFWSMGAVRVGWTDGSAMAGCRRESA